ncbi:MAG: peptidase M14 [Ignavibacteriae bacterium]|nr:peptidase M14 [Ignavibacteriota bacterium]
MKLLDLPKRTPDPARTPNMLARHLFSIYEHFRLDHLTPLNCRHDVVVPELRALVGKSNGVLRCEALGRSLEGRSINLVTCGRGTKRILLWSQMHGDEYTATLALMDIFNFIGQQRKEKWLRDMLDETTLYFIPMLNPDGAEKRQRRTAQNIDMNRDALQLGTPEARALRGLQQKLRPQFGFNLHDQDLATVGDSGEVTALALLAPPSERKRTSSPVRTRAMRVAALLARVLHQFIPRNIATYPDAFEPRAFGDNFQALGTSTVLIESGHWPDDRNKQFVRKLNFVGILTALRCIGNGSYQDVELDAYRTLPQNGKAIYDIIIRDVLLEHSSGWSHTVDIGLAIPTNDYSNPQTVIIKELGDLSTFTALETIAGRQRRISSAALTIESPVELKTLLDVLQLPH